MNDILYPLTFTPIFKDKIWGGQKINELLGWNFSPLSNCGEMWALSGVKNNETLIADGNLADNDVNELLEIFMDDFIGENVFNPKMQEFPLLVKIIDSHDWLSVQVHPDDEMAQSLGYANGKSEMWYIIDAEPDAHIIAGFNREISKEEYFKRVADNTLAEVLSFIPVKKGDAVLIPAGLVHALGPGVLLAEIQQSSDITYRIFDWNRVDAGGKKRELHLDLAAKAIHFDMHEIQMASIPTTDDLNVNIFKTQWFVTNFRRIDLPYKCDYCELDSFVILMFVEGSGNIVYSHKNIEFIPGQAILIPASTHDFIIVPQDDAVSFLEVYISK